MTDNIVYLPLPIANEILGHAQSQPDDEVCGLIGRQDQTHYRCYPIRNIATDRSHRYVMDPAEQIEALRQMRARHESLFAIYHSHPSSAAEPSETDIREAGYPDAVYLIVSLNTRGVLEMRAFKLQGGQASESILTLA